MAEQFPLQGSGSGQVLVLLLSASITPAFKRLTVDRSWKIDFMMQEPWKCSLGRNGVMNVDQHLRKDTRTT